MQLEDLRNVVQQVQPSTSPSVSQPPPPPPPPPPPMMSSGSASELDMTPMSPPSALQQQQQQLPPNWKCRLDKRGKLYYFNEVLKRSQWEFPRVGGLGNSGGPVPSSHHQQPATTTLNEKM
jgi:hypothetical protein